MSRSTLGSRVSSSCLLCVSMRALELAAALFSLYAEYVYRQRYIAYKSCVRLHVMGHTSSAWLSRESHQAECRVCFAMLDVTRVIWLATGLRRAYCKTSQGNFRSPCKKVVLILI